MCSECSCINPRSSGQTARHALILTLLRCLLPFLINLVSIITCLNTFIDLSYNLTEVKNLTTVNLCLR